MQTYVELLEKSVYAFDGSVRFCPEKIRPAKNMRIENALLCGKTFCVDIWDNQYTVTCDGKTYTAVIGETVVLGGKKSS